LAEDETWRAYIMRSVNFIYRCAAVDSVEFSAAEEARCRVTLRPGLDVHWIERHVRALQEQVNAGRSRGGLRPLKALDVVAVE
jgi:hypothetical protein